MLYVIRDTVQFRSEDGVVLLNGVDDPVATLSATMNRLLVHLIDRQGEVCSREDILQKVWDAHGLRSSNNSLNRYITELRKLFNNLGFEEEVITTVPRIGFIFSTDIDISTENFEDKDSELKKTSKPANTDGSGGKLLITTLIVLCIVSLLPLLFSDLTLQSNIAKKRTDSKQTYYLGEINECNVYMLSKASNEMTPVKYYIASALIKKTSLKCDADSVVYFQVTDAVIYGYKDRVFITKCNRPDGNNESFTSCKSFYEVDYVLQ